MTSIADSTSSPRGTYEALLCRPRPQQRETRNESKTAHEKIPRRRNLTRQRRGGDSWAASVSLSSVFLVSQQNAGIAGPSSPAEQSVCNCWETDGATRTQRKRELCRVLCHRSGGRKFHFLFFFFFPSYTKGKLSPASLLFTSINSLRRSLRHSRLFIFIWEVYRCIRDEISVYFVFLVQLFFFLFSIEFRDKLVSLRTIEIHRHD